MSLSPIRETPDKMLGGGTKKDRDQDMYDSSPSYSPVPGECCHSVATLFATLW